MRQIFAIVNRVNVMCCLVIFLACHDALAQARSDDLIPLDQTDAAATTQDWLAQATLLQTTDVEASQALALSALKQSTRDNNLQLAAESASLLAKLAMSQQRFTEAKSYLQQAIDGYRQTNNTRLHINTTVTYAKLMMNDKQYDDAYSLLDNALGLAIQSQDVMLIVSVLNVKGKGLYKQKQYIDAIESYTQITQYLIGEADNYQPRLGNAYHQIGQCYKKLKDYNNASIFHRKALEVHQSLKSDVLISRSLKNIAYAEVKKDQLVVALDYAIQSLDIQESLNDPEEQAELLALIGTIYRYLQRYESSFEYLNNALDIYKRLDDVEKVAENFNQIGFLYTRLDKFDQARSFYQHAVDILADGGDSKTLASAYREIAAIDLEAANYQSARDMGLKAHAIYRDAQDESKLTVTARIVGRAYVGLGDNDSAIGYLEEAAAMAEKSGSAILLVKALNELGIALFDVDIERGVAYLKQSLEVATQADLQIEVRSAYDALKQAAKRKGDFKEALQYAEASIRVIKYIYDARERNKLMSAKAKLDSFKTEAELETLRRKVELDQLALEKKNKEIEIVRQASRITELELAKNRYASLLLTILLLICIAVGVYIFRMVVMSRKRNAELDFLATHDPLTNCANRRALFDGLHRDWSSAHTPKEYCIIMADIDHFKTINDSHGHSTGDAVIKGVTTILQDSVRQTDVVARYGGEEFCIVLPSAVLKHAVRIAENMRQRVESANICGIAVTCSFGVASIQGGAQSPTALLDQADKALYYAKTHGRNCVSAWGETGVDEG